MSTQTTTNTLRRSASRRPYPAIVNTAVTTNAERGNGLGGTLHLVVDPPQVDGSDATVTVCADYRDVQYSKADGAAPQTGAELGKAPELGTLTLLQVGEDGRWMIQSVEGGGAC